MIQRMDLASVAVSGLVATGTADEWVLPGGKLFVASPPDVIPADDSAAPFEGRRGGDLWAVSAKTGKKIVEIYHTDAPPVYDALSSRGALVSLDHRWHGTLLWGK